MERNNTMEVSREIVITFNYKDKKEYTEMIERLLTTKPVGFKQYLELTHSDRELLTRMKNALIAYDKPENCK
jgi:hypothetical protein